MSAQADEKNEIVFKLSVYVRSREYKVEFSGDRVLAPEKIERSVMGEEGALRAELGILVDEVIAKICEPKWKP